jgi:hypothetical protein
MNQEKLKETILDIFNEIVETETTHEEDITEGLSSGMKSLVNFLLGQVKKGKLKRNYDIDTDSGRLVFKTGSGKEAIFNDAKLGVTIIRKWKGRVKKDFFSYNDFNNILKFTTSD